MQVKSDTKAEYHSLLRACRTEESRQPIPNRFPWHSKIALQELANFAKTKQDTAIKDKTDPVVIRMLTGTCPQNICTDETFQSLEDFIRHGGELRVIVLNGQTPSSDNPLYSLRNVNKTSVQFRAPSAKPTLDKINHFFCVGDQAYRFEQPHDDLAEVVISDFSPEVLAVICFNDPNGADRLARYFDALWGQCQSIS